MCKAAGRPVFNREPLKKTLEKRFLGCPINVWGEVYDLRSFV